MIRKILMVAVTSGLAAQDLRLWIQRERDARDARRGAGAAAAGTHDTDRWADDGGAAAEPTKRRGTGRRRAAATKAA